MSGKAAGGGHHRAACGSLDTQRGASTSTADTLAAAPIYLPMAFQRCPFMNPRGFTVDTQDLGREI